MRKSLASLIAFIALSLPLSAYAAIAFDTTIDVVNPASGANNSMTLTGSDITVFCDVLINGTGVTLTGVIFGGTSLNEIFHLDTSNVSGNDQINYFGPLQTTSGTYNAVVNYTGSGATVVFDCMDYTGAGGIEATSSTNGATGSGGTAATTITTATGDWLVGFTRSQSSISTVQVNGATGGTDRNSANGGRDPIDSNGTVTGTSNSLGYTNTGGNNWGLISVALKPFSAAVITSKVPDIIFYGSWDGGW